MGGGLDEGTGVAVEAGLGVAGARGPVSRRKITADLAISVGSQMGFKLLGFLSLTLLARGLGVAGFGSLMFALATSELLVLFTEFGSSNHLVRETATRVDRAAAELGAVLSVRLCLMVPYALAILLILWLHPEQGAAVALIAGGYVAAKDLTRGFTAVFIGARRVALSVITFGSHLCLLIAGIGLAWAVHAGMAGVLVAYVAAAGFLWLVTWGVFVRHFGRPRLDFAWPRLRQVFLACLPLFGLDFMTMVQLRIDASLLGFLGGVADVALYEASARIFEGTQAVVRPMILIFLPLCVAMAARRASAELARSLARLSAAALLAGLAVFGLGALVADRLVVTVYGADFAGSAAVLRLHLAAVPFVFLTAVAMFHATAMQRERTAVLIVVAALVVNVLLDLVLIPRHGPVGAATATLGAEALAAAGITALAWSSIRRMARTG